MNSFYAEFTLLREFSCAFYENCSSKEIENGCLVDSIIVLLFFSNSSHMQTIIKYPATLWQSLCKWEPNTLLEGAETVNFIRC
jgi:hypothetical protein